MSPTLLDNLQRAALETQSSACLAGWCVEHDPNDFWLFYRPEGSATRDAGFKIHLSATLHCAAEVLAQSVPILVRLRVPFKHTVSLKQLGYLSCGRGGLSQIGKFLTAYPPSDDVAHHLAAALHEATKHLEGPHISSESAYAPRSLVHYRYGGFASRWLQLATGQIVPARLGPDGLERDERDGEIPAYARGLELGFAKHPAGDGAFDNPNLCRNWVRVQRLHRGPKGSTWLGFDLRRQTSNLVVIKDAYIHVMEASDGLDAGARLAREAQSLLRLADSGVTPQLLDYWEEDDRCILVYELVEGPTFASIILALAAEGKHPPSEMLHQWMIGLCESLSRLHGRGEVFGDLKPSNLIYLDGRFCFIDLELCGHVTDQPTGSMGTIGYAPPQQLDGSTGRSMLDDIHALGATMLAAATLTDASILPDLIAVAEEERCRHPSDRIYSAIQKCLSRDPADRFQSVEAIAEYLRGATKGGRPGKVVGDAPAPLDLAIVIGDAALRDVQTSELGAYWVSNHPIVGGLAARDLYAGSSGTALFLCELYQATGGASYLETAIRCAEWLNRAPPIAPRQAPMNGLYFGDSGIGWLYLKLHALTGDSGWLERAMDISAQVAASPRRSPDLMTGVSGTGIFQLALWHASHEALALQHALDDAHALMEMRSPSRLTWAMPSEYDTLSGKEYVGFAHGSAGIGYFIAQCCLARSDPELKGLCGRVADWLTELAMPALPDGSALAWPTTMESSSPNAAHWCHGSAGIARFLVSAANATGNASYLVTAERAARLLELGPRWLGTTQCHGLATNIEVLIDVWQGNRGGDALVGAQSLGRNLAAYRVETGWPAEHPGVFTYDLMVGQAGVGAAFLRLHNPERPHLLSPEAFRVQPSTRSPQMTLDPPLSST